MKQIIRALCLAAAMAPSVAAAQVYLPPGVGLPPQSVIGNALPVTGDAVAVSFAQLRSNLNIPALKTCSSHQWFNSLTTGGVLGCSQPSVSDIAGFGTGVATFLGTPSSANLRAALTDETGTGAAVFANGPALVIPNLGTPSVLILTNATGLPISTGMSGLGTGVAAALGTNVGSGGSVVVNGGALGTPSSGVLTNATGLPISTGVSGLAAGCATFLGTATSANLRGCLTDESGTGAAYFQGGDIGTPSAGVATNLTGTAAGLTAGGLADPSASTPFGYATGSGGTVTQLTSRTTGVTLNRPTGAITLFSVANNNAAWTSFTVTNSTVAANDNVVVNCRSSTDTLIAHVTKVSAGSFQITFISVLGTTVESPVIGFSVIRGSNT